MSVRSLPLAVVVAEECGNGVRIGVGAEKFPQRHSLLPGEVENQPAQSGVANPQAYSAIARARSLAAALPFVGCCYNCDALVPDGHRFCDTDCRDDWQRRHEVRR